jgi:hypothetical protein
MESKKVECVVRNDYKRNPADEVNGSQIKRLPDKLRRHWLRRDVRVTPFSGDRFIAEAQA